MPLSLASLITLLTIILAPLPTFAPRDNPEMSPFHELWRPPFPAWELDGLQVVDGRLEINPAQPNSGLTVHGTAISPVHESPELFAELIPSWNAETPAGTWIEPRLRARVAGRWTDWYALGSWSSV